MAQKIIINLSGISTRWRSLTKILKLWHTGEEDSASVPEDMEKDILRDEEENPAKGGVHFWYRVAE